jgi:hypothetical protein
MKRLLLALCFLPGLAAAATLEDDVQGLIKVFSGEKSAHVPAVRTLAWMGVSDARVFDVVEQLLKSDADAARGNRIEQDRVAHYVRALGFSGNAKYMPVLQSYVGDRTYERAANNALRDFPSYQKWNAIISNRAGFDAKYSDDVNRVMNMLAAEDVQLKGLGARRIFHAPHHDEVLLERLAQEAKANYARSADPETSDAIAWMLKALGSARDPKYAALLEEAAKGAPDRKIRNGAAAGLKYYSR